VCDHQIQSLWYEAEPQPDNHELALHECFKAKYPPPIPYRSCIEINRKINIIQVDAVTISQNSKCHELIIHVKGEYDYRYVSPNYHELVATTIRSIMRIKGLKVNLYKVVRVSIH
jgi:hypothetical protein